MTSLKHRLNYARHSLVCISLYSSGNALAPFRPAKQNPPTDPPKYALVQFSSIIFFKASSPINRLRPKNRWTSMEHWTVDNDMGTLVILLIYDKNQRGLYGDFYERTEWYSPAGTNWCPQNSSSPCFRLARGKGRRTPCLNESCL